MERTREGGKLTGEQCGRLDHYLHWEYIGDKFILCERYDDDEEFDRNHWKNGNYYAHRNMRYVSEMINKMNECLKELNILHNSCNVK